jgi:hypothetical protein
MANSQEYIYQRGLATLSMGIAIPAYDFGRMKGVNLSSYAKVGTNITGEIAYFYSWHVGVAFMLNYNVNPVDKNRLSNGYIDSSPAFKTANASTEPFRDISGLAGLVFDIPPNEYISFTFKMMGGLRNVYKPTALIRTTTTFSNVDYYETSDNRTVFAFLTSMGGRVIINDNFNAHLTASYIGSTIHFKYKRNSKTINEKAHIGVLMITGGVSYSF